jgi:GTP-binding protein
VLLSKADKLSRSQAHSTLKDVAAKALGYASAQLFSSVTKAGVDEARACVLGMLAEPVNLQS